MKIALLTYRFKALIGLLSYLVITIMDCFLSGNMDIVENPLLGYILFS